MSKHNPLRSRRLQIESLESRGMLTGSITATVDNGVLNVEGAGDLIIHQLPQTFEGDWPGVKLELLGKDNGGHQTTNINGQDSVILAGIKSGVNIQDSSIVLRIGNSAKYGGSPTVHRSTVALPGNVTIHTAIARMYIENHTKVTVNGTSGGDDILLSGCKLNKLDVNADTGLNTASDTIRVLNVHATGAVNIDMGGNQRDGGFDFLKIDSRFGSVFEGGFNVVTHSLSDLSATGSEDYPVVFNGALNFQGGSGSDSVLFDHAEINGSLAAAFGGGDDAIQFKNTNAARVALDGGAGFDRLFTDLNSNLGEESITGFESQQTT